MADIFLVAGRVEEAVESLEKALVQIEASGANKLAEAVRKRIEGLKTANHANE